MNKLARWAGWLELPVDGPAILLEELGACFLESKVRAQVGRLERLAGERIAGVSSQMLHDGGSLVRLARLGLQGGSVLVRGLHVGGRVKEAV